VLRWDLRDILTSTHRFRRLGSLLRGMVDGYVRRPTPSSIPTAGVRS
jgi:hypothetical protein